MHKVRAKAVHDILYMDIDGKSAFAKAGAQPILPKCEFDKLKALGAVVTLEEETLPLFSGEVKEEAEIEQLPKRGRKTTRRFR